MPRSLSAPPTTVSLVVFVSIGMLTSGGTFLCFYSVGVMVPTDTVDESLLALGAATGWRVRLAAAAAVAATGWRGVPFESIETASRTRTVEMASAFELASVNGVDVVAAVVTKCWGEAAVAAAARLAVDVVDCSQ